MRTQYEFTYAYEPQDETRPVRLLYVTVDFGLVSEPQAPDCPASTRLDVTRVAVSDSSGRDLTEAFMFLRQKLIREFETTYASRAVAEVLEDV